MRIIESGLSFNKTPDRRTSTRRIILHHAAASVCTVQDVHGWHRNNGWGGIGYHYFVRKDGSVYRGRPENMIGAHAGNNNGDSIGICFEGNLETDIMPAAQSMAGAALIEDIKSRYGALSVIRHKDVNTTACPGKNFPFDKIKAGAPAPARPPSDDALYRVQVGAFKIPAGADETIRKLKFKGYETLLVVDGGLHKVQTGAFANRANAEVLAAKLKKEGFETYISEGEATISAAKPSTPVIKVGSRVKVKSGARDYTGKSLADFVYNTVYTVLEISCDRVVIGIGKAVTAAVRAADLSLI